MKLMKTSQSQCAVNVCYQKQLQPSAYKMLTERRICAFIEHNLPLSLCQSLIDLMKVTCPANTMEKDKLHN